MKRIFAIMCALFVVFAVCLTGCTAKPDPTSVYNDGIIGENKHYDRKKRESVYPYESDALEEAVAADKTDAVDGWHYEHTENNIDPQAGLLTAGEWKDRDNLTEWFEKSADEKWIAELSSRGFYSANVFPVHIVFNGSDVYNIGVNLLDNDNNVLYTAVTDVNGMAYLFCPDDKLGDLKISVGETIRLVTEADLGIVSEIDSNTASSELKELDLMLMIDTTGSMGDELEYLKAELADVVNRVAEDTAFAIRVSVNFYRDEGDEYVVKYFDFRDDVKECVDQMSEQYAYGGGDYPEAVHTALDNAINGHQWNEDAIKLCFLVLDAPPHTADEIQDVNSSLMESILKAAELSIRIIPVASSGVDLPTEIDLRSFAIMTGGTYIFLTNDSGIGNDHLEASVGEFTVEPLNDCMVRIINEYCGVQSTVSDEETTVEPETQETTTENPNYPNP